MLLEPAVESSVNTNALCPSPSPLVPVDRLGRAHQHRQPYLGRTPL